MTARFANSEDFLALRHPERPVACLRPHVCSQAAARFVAHFPGDVLYAFKANGHPMLLDAMWEAGVRAFDVASIEEMAAVCARFPDAELHLMNPVKSRETIRRAYHDFGVRSFALDSDRELDKILTETGRADDLLLSVRLAARFDDALIPLDRKFGAQASEAVGLVQQTRRHCRQLGVTFHVGSQTLAPDAFATMLARVGGLIVEAGVLVDMVDVGGGFPTAYPGMAPSPMDGFFDVIAEGLAALKLPDTCRVVCEPGRALVAEAEALLVRVDGRRGDELYINDGVYGALFDAGHSDLKFPVRAAEPSRFADEALTAFSLWGPTCDSIDFMPGPYPLPASIDEGDYIEIGNIGAYGRALSTGFNGFGRYDDVVLTDPPQISIWSSEREQHGGHEQPHVKAG